MLSLEALKGKSVYWIEQAKLIEKLQIEFQHGGEFDIAMLESTLNTEIQNSEIMRLIKNFKARNVMKHDEIMGSNYDGFQTKEFQDSITTVNRNLNDLIKKRIEKICLELKIPLQRKRSLHFQKAFLENRIEILDEFSEKLNIPCQVFPSKTCTKPFLKTCIYDDMDLFDAIKAVAISNLKPGLGLWSALSVPIQTDTIEMLESRFPELSPLEPQLGLHNLSKIPVDDNKFEQTHFEAGEALLAIDSINDLRDFCKRGISASHRPQIWKKLLASEFLDASNTEGLRTCYFLRQKMQKFDLLMDRVLHLDAKHAQNDDSYFVFEDLIRDMMLLWTRDMGISVKQLGVTGSEASNGTDGPLLDDENQGFNGIFTIWGFSLYTMPVCYLYSTTEAGYMTFREMYARYFHKLHTISNNSESILYLCALFENLVKQKCSQLFFYASFDLHMQPLEIAFRWMLYGFVGILEIEQLLLLWDRVIAYDTTHLLALTAAALFVYRKDNIMKCKTKEEAMLLFSDNLSIKWVPLVLSFFDSNGADLK